MCTIPYLTCNVNSLLLLPKSNVETPLNTYLFICFTGHKELYSLPIGLGIKYVNGIAYCWWNIACATRGTQFQMLGAIADYL